MKIQVLNWSEHFENAKSRERDKCSFVCIPNKMGMGLSLMLSEPNGCAMYGMWCLLVAKLSRQNKPRNGILTCDGNPDSRAVTAQELAIMWRQPLASVQHFLTYITSDNLGWCIDLEASDTKRIPDGHLVPAEYPPSTLEGRKEGMEGKKENGKAVVSGFDEIEGRQPLTEMDINAVYAAYPRKVGKPSALNAIRKALVKLARSGTVKPDAGSWLLEKVQEFANSPAGNAGKFVPHPARWFNEERFNDDPEEWNREANSGANGYKSTQSSSDGYVPTPEAYAACAEMSLEEYAKTLEAREVFPEWSARYAK